MVLTNFPLDHSLTGKFYEILYAELQISVETHLRERMPSSRSTVVRNVNLKRQKTNVGVLGARIPKRCLNAFPSANSRAQEARSGLKFD
jgi:hypothetical protein